MIAEITHGSRHDNLCACRTLPLGEGSSTHRNLNSIIHDAKQTHELRTKLLPAECQCVHNHKHAQGCHEKGGVSVVSGRVT